MRQQAVEQGAVIYPVSVPVRLGTLEEGQWIAPYPIAYCLLFVFHGIIIY
jgi:hypothetical protein